MYRLRLSRQRCRVIVVMEKMSVLKFRAPVLLLSGFICSIPLFSQTLRQDAEQRFGSVEWTEPGEIVSATELPGKNIPGGNESFPLLLPSVSAPAASVFPSFRNLGLLDYTTMGDELLAAARALSSSLLLGSLDPALCSSNRAWLPVLTNYRLKELQKPENVRFSQSDDTDPDKPVIRFYTGNEGSAPYRMYTVTFIRESDSWMVWDFQFSGETDGTGAIKD